MTTILRARVLVLRGQPVQLMERQNEVERLDQVRAAYERLAKGHGLGKIVLEVTPAP